MAQPRHDARAGLAQALLNGPCLGPAHETRPIWPSIPPYDNDSPRLSCRHLVRHPASFLSLLMPRLHATPFSAEGVGAGASSPYSSDTNPRIGYCTSTRTSQHARTIVFVVVGRLVRLPGLRPVLPPQHAAPAHGRSRGLTDARRCGYGRVGLAPGLSPCVPPRRTQWRLPRLGNLGDEESRFEILDNQGP
jgi:hypothetical protein